MYAALGVTLLEIDIPGILADVKEGRQPATPAYPMTEVPPARRQSIIGLRGH